MRNAETAALLKDKDDAIGKEQAQNHIARQAQLEAKNELTRMEETENSAIKVMIEHYRAAAHKSMTVAEM